MKKIIVIFLISLLLLLDTVPALAIAVGTYKTESEYGLLDGFKINWKRKDKSEPFIELREESTAKEKEKELNDFKENEYEYTKNMYEGQVLY